MKKMKKMIALVLSMVMVLAMSSLTAFAASDGGTITLNDAVIGEGYQLYKVFNATTNGDGIAYSSAWMTDSNDYFEVDSVGNITITAAGKDVTDPTKLSSEAITWLKGQISSFTAIGTVQTATSDIVSWTGLEPGYYYISTTTGSFVTISSAKPNATVNEKNTVPSMDKKQKATEADEYLDDQLDLNIGDTVYYQVVITNGKGTDKDIVLTDTMNSGLTLDTSSIKIMKDNSEVNTAQYVLDTAPTTNDTWTFKLTLLSDYVKTLSENDTVIVTYTATINPGAVIRANNTNTAVLSYSNQTMTDAVVVKTYDFQLKKTDGTNYLAGAGFKLYDALTNGNEIKVTEDDTGYYVDANGTAEIQVDNENGVNVRGLEPGDYYLEETTTPAGYNKLLNRKKLTITKDATDIVQVEVVNNKGVELPETGGMGTTIFYVVGGILVACAVILLVTKRRMNTK